MFYTTLAQAHAVALVAALVFFVLAEILILGARGGRHMLARAALLVGDAGGLLAGLGVLGGIALVAIGPWPLLSSWLLASFALMAILLAVGRVLVSPWENRWKAAVRAGSSTEIAALSVERRALFGRATMIALFVLIMVVMSAKPTLFH